jgi:hypothetical protein
MLDTIALLDEEGPDAPGSAPAKWTFRWHDPQEIGGKVRSASIPAPKGATWSSGLRFAAASGSRAMFAVRSGGKLRLVRVKPAGGAEVVDAAADLLPAGEVVFGEGHSEAIAWSREAQVIVWLPGERPRPIARLGTHATRTLGAPTLAGVPLLLGSADWSLQRTLPIPPLEKATAADPPAARVSLDGWTALQPLPRRLEALPACSAKAAGSGARFTLAKPGLRAEIDGAAESASQAIYEVRVDGGSACVASVTAALAPERSKGAAPKAGGTPAAFVRVDLAGRRAEGGERGLPPAAIKRMICALAARP